jgi:putative spermidine/putrescine transport system ATP-binding protein
MAASRRIAHRQAGGAQPGRCEQATAVLVCRDDGRILLTRTGLVDRPASGITAREDVLVRFSGVAKTYDGRTLVISDLDLDVRTGEFLTLLGPSGSGKTTTLMMLAGFEVPTRGTISVAGRDITRVPPHKRGIGMVFQNYALFPHMTVAENLAFPLSVRGIGREERERHIARALDMVRLEDLGGRMPVQLSGGQQQRVALARALIFNPQLVLMDEPLGALDRQLREHMQIEIKGLHERLGLTFVYVTHDQGEALTMSDRIAVFSDGRVHQIAPPRDIYDAPATPFVARFIGDNNRITGRVETVEGELAVVATKSGERFACTALTGIGLGQEVMLSIRPEAVTLLQPGAGVPAAEARIAAIVYHGDHFRLHLTTRGGETIAAKAPVREAQGLSIGDDVLIGWRPEDARVLATA